MMALLGRTSIDEGRSPGRLVRLIAACAERPHRVDAPRQGFAVRDCVALVQRLDDHAPPARAEVVDVGFRNVGFLADTPLPLGVGVTIEFEWPRIDLRITPCAVIAVDARADGRYHIEVEFDGTDACLPRGPG
ncbi:MAG: hypothetical protein KDA25_05065 [Phycisphaerales bacterium]|nr:hypothetical protein [Phycisphaerales bacterium]